MHGDAALAPRRTDHALGQQRHADPGGDAAENALDRAELEPPHIDDAARRQYGVEAIAVGAAGAEDDGLEAALAGQLVEMTNRARRHQHELLAEYRILGQFGVIDRSADEGAFEIMRDDRLDK